MSLADLINLRNNVNGVGGAFEAFIKACEPTRSFIGACMYDDGYMCLKGLRYANRPLSELLPDPHMTAGQVRQFIPQLAANDLRNFFLKARDLVKQDGFNGAVRTVLVGGGFKVVALLETGTIAALGLIAGAVTVGAGIGVGVGGGLNVLIGRPFWGWTDISSPSVVFDTSALKAEQEKFSNCRPHGNGTLCGDAPVDIK